MKPPDISLWACSSGRSTPNFGLLAAGQRSALFWRHLGPAPGQSIDDGVLLLRGATEKEPAGKSCGGRRWCLGVIWCLHLILVLLPELAFSQNMRRLQGKVALELCQHQSREINHFYKGDPDYLSVILFIYKLVDWPTQQIHSFWFWIYQLTKTKDMIASWSACTS